VPQIVSSSSSTAGVTTRTQGRSPTAAELVTNLNTIPELNGKVQVTVVGSTYNLTFDPSVAQVQLTSAVTGGVTTPVVTTTPGVAGSPTAAEVEANLRTIPALAGNVIVVGPGGGPFKVFFGNGLTGEQVPPITVAVTGGTVGTIAQDNFAQVSRLEVQRIAFAPTTGTIINPGTATFTLSLPIGATGQNLTTPAISYSNDPVVTAANIQRGFDALFAVPPTNGVDIIANPTLANQIGNVIVTPLSPTEFQITFQNNLANVNWPQLTAAVSNSGGSNLATPAITTIYNGVGNAAQTIALSGGNDADFILAFNGVATSGNLVFSNDGSPSPTATELQNFINQIPALANNVFVMGNRINSQTPGPFYVVFRNELAGVGVPDIIGWSNNNRDVLATAVSVAGSQRSTSVEGVRALVLNGGLLGVGTDVLTTGGLTIWGSADPQNAILDSQIFAEGGNRTIKAVSFAQPGNATNSSAAGTYRLGGRREFGNTGPNNTLTISQAQLKGTPFPPAQTLRQNVNSGAFAAQPNQTFITDDPLATVQIGGAAPAQVLNFVNKPNTGATFTISFRGATTQPIAVTAQGNDQADIQNKISLLSTVTSVGGTVEVTRIVDLDYAFLVKFGGGLADQEIPLLTATQGGVFQVQARGGGSLIEDLVNPLTLNTMNLVKTGVGTLTLAGNNTFKGSMTVNQGILRVMSSNALGQPLGLVTGGTVVNAGASLQIGRNVSINDEQLTLSGSGSITTQSGSGANIGALNVVPQASMAPMESWSSTGSSPLRATR
jgi:autotransporter-associated beta strand protein